MTDDAQALIDSLRSRVVELEGALQPFAAIVPSTLYPADGSENEGYCVLLAPINGNPVEYTGKDLARARTALTQGVRHDD